QIVVQGQSVRRQVLVHGAVLQHGVGGGHDLVQIHVQGLAVGLLIVGGVLLQGLGVGGGVPDEVHVLQVGLGGGDEVDPLVGLVHVLGVLQDAHGVHKPVGALLGDDEGQVGVGLVHGQEVAGVVGGDGQVAALHDLEDLVHALAGVHTPGLGVGHQLIGLPDLGLIGGVHVIAQVVQSHGEGVTGVVNEQDVSSVV